MVNGQYGLVLREVGRLLGGGTVTSMGAGQLLERFVNDRDSAAFEALVTRHGPMVLGTCRRMLSDPHDVDDAFQATFLVLARKAGSIEDADRLGPWLHGVARRVAARSRALSSRRKSRERQVGDEPDGESPDLLEGLELREALDEELSHLPEKYRAPLVLCYLEGLTHDEAARQLRWPVGTVRSRLAGGRDRLRARLTRRGLSPSAAVPAILTQASIPQTLLSTTVRVATSAGWPSAHVLNLAKGVLIAMTWNKLKLIAAVGLTAGLTVGGAGVAAQQGGAGKAEAPPADRAVQAEVGRVASQKGEADKFEVRVEEMPTTREQVEQERKRVTIEYAEVARRIEQIRTEQAKEIGELEKRLGKLNSRSEMLADRWKELAENADPDNPRNRIARLEKELADQRAMIQLQQDRLNQFRGVPIEEKSTKTAAPAPGATVDQPKMEAIPKPSAEPKKIANPIGPGGGIALANAAPQAPQPDLLTWKGGPGEPTLLAIISAQRDRAVIFNTDTNLGKTYRAPNGVKILMIKIIGPVVALELTGPEVTQLAVFDRYSSEWSTHDLKRPAKGKDVGIGLSHVGQVAMDSADLVLYRVDRSIYLYNPVPQKWSSLELNDPLAASLMHIDGDRATILDGDVVHLYDVRSGDWTHINTKDDK